MDSSLFYIEGTQGASPKYPKEAVEVCAGCPVREPCLQWALHHEGEGYQGGTSPAQRKRMRRDLRISLWEPQQNLLGTIVTKKTSHLAAEKYRQMQQAN